MGKIWIRPNPSGEARKFSEGERGGSGKVIDNPNGPASSSGAGLISDKTLFIPELNKTEENAQKILNEGLSYERSKMESNEDTFYCMFNHSITESAEIVADGGFSLEEWIEYKAMYGIQIEEHLIAQKLELVRKVTAPDHDSEMRSDFIGTLNVPKWMNGIPKHMTREKQEEVDKPQLEVLIDTSYNSCYSAQNILQTMVCIAAILQNMFEDNPGFSLKALRGTILDLSDSVADELIMWQTSTVPPSFGIFDWIHHFVPMHTRGLTFVQQAHISKFYPVELTIQAETDFKENGMGRPYPGSYVDGENGMYTLGELYEQQPKMAAFDEELRKNGSHSDVLVMSLAKISDTYNNFDTKDDIDKFVEDVKERVEGLEEALNLR